MVSRTARYALRILGYLAARPGERIPGEQIAGETGVPANYLSKIMNQLRKQGLVDAEKGWGGGFSLRKRTLRRPVREVLAIIDGAESTERRECLFGLPRCDDENPCPLHPYWERIREVYGEMLSEVRVRDLAT